MCYCAADWSPDFSPPPVGAGTLGRTIGSGRTGPEGRTPGRTGGTPTPNGRGMAMPGHIVRGRVGRNIGTGMPGPMAGVGRPVRTGRAARVGGLRGLVGGKLGLNGLIGGKAGLIGGDVGLIGGDGTSVGKKVTLSGLVGGEAIDILVEGGSFSDVELANGSAIVLLAGMKAGCKGQGAVVGRAAVGGTDPFGSCCTTEAGMAVPIIGGGGAPPMGGRGMPPMGGRGMPPMGGRGMPPMGGRGAPPMVEIGLRDSGGVGPASSCSPLELPLMLESSSEEVAGGVFFGACFPPLGPFPFSLFQDKASWGASRAGSLASTCRGSSLAGFKLWAFGKGTVGSACSPWRAFIARMFTLGSFSGRRVVRGSEMEAAAFGAPVVGIERGPWGGEEGKR